MTVIDEFATVWASPAGTPERFVWRGQRFVVVAKAIPWVDRTDWWAGTQRVAVGTAATVLEQRMWQVEASAEDGGGIQIFDLAVGEAPDRWRVSRLHE